MENHAAVISAMEVEDFRLWLKRSKAGVHLLSVGRAIDLYKDEGHPKEISRRFHFEKMVLVRDTFACKPAVAAETDDYVAVASEFRGLAHLPDIKSADVFEPVPEQICSWKI